MKKKLFFLFALSIAFMAKSQIVFCPAGAEWHYLFQSGELNSPYHRVFNQKIKYDRDSLIGSVEVKVLKHDRFFLECDGESYSPSSKLTLIKQQGDTVFFRNTNTNHTWQILFNFNCLPGQSWQNTIYENASTVRIYTTTVHAVPLTVINGVTLRQLKVTESSFSDTITITERLGQGPYLFNFYNHTTGSCDGDMFGSPLCYSDGTFGSYHYSSNFDCNYATTPVSVKAYENNAAVSVYPNPFSDNVIIKADNYFEEAQVVVFDNLGREVLHRKLNLTDPAILDIRHLQKGIYFLQVKGRQNPIAFKKIIKE